MCISALVRSFISESLLCKLVVFIINPHLTVKLLLRKVWSAQFLIHFGRTAGINNLRLFFFSS